MAGRYTALPDQTSILTEEDDMRLLFEKCCHESTPALFVVGDGTRVLQTQFHSLSEDGVAFRLPLDESEDELAPFLKPLVPCSVVFFTGLHSRFFVSHIVAPGGGTGDLDFAAHTLYLRLPRFVAGTEGRMSFRVPVAEDSPLKVQVVMDDGEVWHSRPKDLSATGALLQFDHNNDPCLKDGQEVRVNVVLGRRKIQLNALVRWASERKYGVYFQDIASATDIEPPEELQAILKDLEKLWLKEKSKAESVPSDA